MDEPIRLLSGHNWPCVKPGLPDGCACQDPDIVSSGVVDDTGSESQQ